MMDDKLEKKTKEPDFKEIADSIADSNLMFNLTNTKKIILKKHALTMLENTKDFKISNEINKIIKENTK